MNQEALPAAAIYRRRTRIEKESEGLSCASPL